MTSVIILNWNTSSYLERFLPGVIASCQDAEIVVADNGSTDGSLETLKRFPQVRTIALDRNYGFTGGYDRTVPQTGGDYVLLLNSDVETPEGWLKPLEEWMDAHPDCAACGPKLLKFDARDEFEYAGAAGGYVDRYGFPFCRGRVLSRTEKDCGQYDEPREVMWVSGAALMVRRSVWDALGGLDARFFAHMEEIDFCWRARRMGFSVWVVPQSRVYHLGGGTLPQTSPWKLELNYRNNLLMLRNNLPSRTRFAFRYLLDLGAALGYLLTLKPDYAAAVVRAHRQYRALKGPRAARVKGSVYGYCEDLLILPLFFLKGKGIFKYLKTYEDSHCRCR